MDNQKQTVKPFLETVLDKNSHVDKDLVEMQNELEKKLKDLGVRTKPTFGIEPALGHNHVKFNCPVK